MHVGKSSSRRAGYHANQLIACGERWPSHQTNEPCKPAVRQLLHSLLPYVDSPAFTPKVELYAGLLKRLFPDKT